MKRRTHSYDETFELARRFASKLSAGDVVLLIGELGAGKTCFVQGMASGLGVPNSLYVRSPSFALVNEYRGGMLPLYHFDFYRLNEGAELVDIGLDEYISGDGVTVIEWADRFRGALPADAVEVRFDIEGENEREITITGEEDR